MIGVVNSIALIGGIVGALTWPGDPAAGVGEGRVPGGQLALCRAAVLTFIVPAAWEVGCSVFLVMLALVPLNAILESYQVRLVPDQVSGRVAAVVSFGSQGLMWVGPLVAGVLADILSPPIAGLIVAACVLPTVVIAHFVTSLDVLRTPVEEVGEHPC